MVSKSRLVMLLIIGLVLAATANPVVAQTMGASSGDDQYGGVEGPGGSVDDPGEDPQSSADVPPEQPGETFRNEYRCLAFSGEFTGETCTEVYREYDCGPGQCGVEGVPETYECVRYINEYYTGSELDRSSEFIQCFHPLFEQTENAVQIDAEVCVYTFRADGTLEGTDPCDFGAGGDVGEVADSDAEDSFENVDNANQEINGGAGGSQSAGSFIDSPGEVFAREPTSQQGSGSQSTAGQQPVDQEPAAEEQAAQEPAPSEERGEEGAVSGKATGVDSSAGSVGSGGSGQDSASTQNPSGGEGIDAVPDKVEPEGSSPQRRDVPLRAPTPDDIDAGDPPPEGRDVPSRGFGADNVESEGQQGSGTAADTSSSSDDGASSNGEKEDGSLQRAGEEADDNVSQKKEADDSDSESEGADNDAGTDIEKELEGNGQEAGSSAGEGVGSEEKIEDGGISSVEGDGEEKKQDDGIGTEEGDDSEDKNQDEDVSTEDSTARGDASDKSTTDEGADSEIASSESSGQDSEYGDEAASEASGNNPSGSGGVTEMLPETGGLGVAGGGLLLLGCVALLAGLLRRR